MGIDWSIREGYAWVEDKEHCEEYGRMLQADPTKARPNETPMLGGRGVTFRPCINALECTLARTWNLNISYFKY